MFRRQLVLWGGNRSYQEITLTFLDKWIGSKLDSYTNWLKGKLLNCQARARSGFYELAWFIFPGKGSERESFPLLLGSFQRTRHWSIRVEMIHHGDQTERPNIKHILLISNSDYPTQYVVFLKPLGLSGKYWKCHFIGEFSDLFGYAEYSHMGTDWEWPVNI